MPYGDLCLLGCLHIFASLRAENAPYLHAFLFRFIAGVQDVRRLSASRKSYQKVSRLGIDFYLVCKAVVPTEVVRLARDNRRVRECVGFDSGVQEVVGDVGGVCSRTAVTDDIDALGFSDGVYKSDLSLAIKSFFVTGLECPIDCAFRPPAAFPISIRS